MLERYDLLTPIHEDDFSIDNSEVAGEEVAAKIASMVGIKPAEAIALVHGSGGDHQPVSRTSRRPPGLPPILDV